MSFNLRLTRHIGDVSLNVNVHADEPLVALFGPSGAGKTSILNMVAGLLRPDAGRIEIGGELLFDSAQGVNLPARHRRAGYVFQDGRLFPHLRVDANLHYGWNLAAPEHRWLSVDDAVEFLGIGHLLKRWPHSLSGGEAQRVAIGRALLSGPRFLLMDEPLAGLDAARRAEIMTVIERMRDTLRLPILYVSHDRAEVERLTARIIAV